MEADRIHQCDREIPMLSDQPADFGMIDPNELFLHLPKLHLITLHVIHNRGVIVQNKLVEEQLSNIMKQTRNISLFRIGIM